jgi:prevent-host-death family protein
MNRQTVGVRELRQNLSVYLARVKRGTTYTVTEHGRIVALLRPAAATDDVVERMVAEGRATRARKPISAIPKALPLALDVPLSSEVDILREDTV